MKDYIIIENKDSKKLERKIEVLKFQYSTLAKRIAVLEKELEAVKKIKEAKPKTKLTTPKGTPKGISYFSGKKKGMI